MTTNNSEVNKNNKNDFRFEYKKERSGSNELPTPKRLIAINKFIILLYCMKKDKKENLQINFSMDYDLLFGKLYIKYSIFLKGTFQEEIYIRIGYNLEEYKSNKLFTIANIYIDLINKGELDSDFDFEKKILDNTFELKSYLNFI